MIEPLMILGCIGICIGALGCGYALYRLHRICPRAGIECDRGLMRFYCGGFDLPVRIASVLTLLSAVLLGLSLLLKMPAGLVLAALMLFIVSLLEERLGKSDRRKLQRAAHRIGCQ
jgi:4-amino-4-deoxy-L-arabinose transferase-like glycosyltransferase